MARYKLSDTFNTDIAVNFRYEIVILTNDEGSRINGVQDAIVGYATQAELPCAPGEAIEWYMPMGMRNHQAGKQHDKCQSEYGNSARQVVNAKDQHIGFLRDTVIHKRHDKQHNNRKS